MPWTRLHALRGYRDLLIESVETKVPWTVNIVPGLWQQLMAYAEGGEDEHLELSRKDADSLTAAEIERVLQTFPCGNPQMRDLPRYRELEQKLAEGRLSTGELQDLQVLSTLVWMGATALRDFPVLVELLDKGRDFTRSDKEQLLDVQDGILRQFPVLLRELASTEGPRLSTTPLHHPILPLLIDLGFASRSVQHPPTTKLQLPEHALLQLMRGKAYLEQACGQAIQGCWPSEGAVCPELVPLLAEAGFRWVATDEDVLARSQRTGSGEGGWDLGDGVVGFFRDRSLSDKVGFDYARWTDGAAEDFLRRAASPGVKLVALDGENPWEAFRDAGGAFRARMIEGLMTDGITLDEAATRPPVGEVKRLHTGSWIGANLEIWAGSPEDHRAWELLASTWRAVEGCEEAVEPMLAAEGSDWFWWYGPEFDTPFASVFDAAFRGHLSAAWRAAGLNPPDALAEPIGALQSGVVAPARPINPALGEPGWFGCGSWTLTAGAMARGEGQRIDFGWDPEGELWLRGPEGLEIEVGGGRVVLQGEGQPIGHHDDVVLMARGQRAHLVWLDWVV